MNGALGEYIRERREQIGIRSLRELAERVGVSRKTLYGWMDDGRGIRVGNLFALARALQVHPVVVLRKISPEVFTYPVTARPRVRFDDCSFVDETVPDDSVIASHAVFDKTWWLQNTGSVTWRDRRLACEAPERRQLYVRTETGYEPFPSCTLTPHAPSIPVPLTRPDESVELTVTFTAPTLPGTALSVWYFVDADGRRCYPDKSGIWCQVKVTGFY